MKKKALKVESFNFEDRTGGFVKFNDTDDDYERNLKKRRT
jgi:hypothetical protein